MTEAEITRLAVLDPSVCGYLVAALIVTAFVLNIASQLYKARSRR